MNKPFKNFFEGTMVRTKEQLKEDGYLLVPVTYFDPKKVYDIMFIYVDNDAELYYGVKK